MVTKKSGYDMDDVPVANQGNTLKPADVVDLYELPDKKFVKLRFFGSIHAYGGHWIETKKKDGSKGSYYYPCAAFDIEAGKTDSTKSCPWCDDESGHVRFATDYFINGIHRKDQLNKPERVRATAAETESGYKEKSSESWTPVKAVRLTGSVLRRLQEMKQLNTQENADGDTMNYAVSHPRYGADVSIKRDKALSPAQMYDVQIGTQSAMSKEERGYLVWDLEHLMITPSTKEAEGEYVKWAKRMGLMDDKAPVKGKKAVPADDEDDEDEDEDDEPVAKKKPVAKKAAPAAKKKVVVEDDDEDDFDDEDDEPAPKKKPVAKKAAPVDDDEDDDFDDEDDEPVAKKKPVAAKKKAAPVDDDEDDEPVAKKKPVAKKAAPVDDDEDDDFDDEDDEPVAKKPVAKKAAPAAKKKAAPVDDDEDDEDF